MWFLVIDNGSSAGSLQVCTLNGLSLFGVNPDDYRDRIYENFTFSTADGVHAVRVTERFQLVSLKVEQLATLQEHFLLICQIEQAMTDKKITDDTTFGTELGTVGAQAIECLELQDSFTADQLQEIWGLYWLRVRWEY